MILKLYDFPNTRQNELGEIFNLSKGSVAKYLAKLEEEDLILREKMDNNQRMYKLSLQKKALDLVPKLLEISRDWENNSGLNDLNPEFISEFKKLVDKSNEIGDIY